MESYCSVLMPKKQEIPAATLNALVHHGLPGVRKRKERASWLQWWYRFVSESPVGMCYFKVIAWCSLALSLARGADSFGNCFRWVLGDRACIVLGKTTHQTVAKLWPFTAFLRPRLDSTSHGRQACWGLRPQVRAC
jgi:hypothetical protein